MSDCLEAALSYAALGWHVFPVHGITSAGKCTCKNPTCNPKNWGKHPRTKNGWKAATTDEKQIRDWWRKWPDANVAIATGLSDLGIIDVDVGEGKEGEKSAARLESEYGRFPLTLEVITGSGGRHLYYDARNVDVLSKSDTFGLPHVDTRGIGGYIIAPPSQHKSGNRYAWKAGRSLADVSLAIFPAWASVAATATKKPANQHGREKASSAHRRCGDASIKRDPKTGKVIDGREGLLTRIVWRDFQKALALNDACPTTAELCKTVWESFNAEADLSDGEWSRPDVQKKVCALLRRFESGELLLNDAEREPSPAPHYPRPTMDGERAGKRLQWIIRAYFNRIERILDAIEYQGHLVKNRFSRARAKREAKKKYRLRSFEFPKIQIKAVAGLGKTTAMFDEYLRRPYLWKLHIHFYVPTLKLAEELNLKLQHRITPEMRDGKFMPRSIVIYGRITNETGRPQCHPERVEVIKKGAAIVSSTFGAFCNNGHDDLFSSKCSQWAWCNNAGGYCAQFSDQSPALRFFPHAHLTLNQADDLKLPSPDIVIIDESAIEQIIAHEKVDPCWLTDPTSYRGEAYDVQGAINTGVIIQKNISKDHLIENIRMQNVTSEDLRKFAQLALAENSFSDISPSLTTKQILSRLDGRQISRGKGIAALYNQLATDLENGRAESLAIEYIQPRESKDGTITTPSVLHVYHLRELAFPKIAALCIIDADANSEINRIVFDSKLRSFNLSASRRGFMTQCTNVAMPKKTLLSHARDYHKKFRDFVIEHVNQEKKVLVVTNKPVRRIFTGEEAIKLPVSVGWNGTQITHFGALLGVNHWNEFDVVIIIGREQMPPLAAEQMARAIYGNMQNISLNLTGEYIYQLRGYDMRDGTLRGVKVQVHPDSLVQTFVELKRECGIAQAIDRLRLIYPDDRQPEIFIFCNIPVAGIAIDRLCSFSDMLKGDIVWERALKRTGGTLPLVPHWLAQHLPALFSSKRTAERDIERLRKNATLLIETTYRLASFRHHSQTRWSSALIVLTVPNPREELERLLGEAVIDFSLTENIQKGKP